MRETDKRCFASGKQWRMKILALSHSSSVLEVLKAVARVAPGDIILAFHFGMKCLFSFI